MGIAGLLRGFSLAALVAFWSALPGLLVDVHAEPGAAPDAARIEAARRLIETTGAAKELEGMIPRVMALMQTQFERRAPKSKKEIGEVMAGLGSKYDARRAELVDKVAQQYAATLTAEELDAVTKFFSDGPGQRYIRAVPELVRGTQDAGREWGRKLAEEIRRDVEAELKKRKVSLQ